MQFQPYTVCMYLLWLMNWSTLCDSRSSCEVCGMRDRLCASYCVMASSARVYHVCPWKTAKCIRSGLGSLLLRLPAGISRSHLPFVTAVAGAKHLGLVLQLRFGEMSLTPHCATVVIAPIAPNMLLLGLSI